MKKDRLNQPAWKLWEPLYHSRFNGCLDLGGEYPVPAPDERDAAPHAETGGSTVLVAKGSSGCRNSD